MRDFVSGTAIKMNAQNSFWPSVEKSPPLPVAGVHVCAWNLDVVPIPSDWGILSAEETDRARRFVFPRDRDRYVRAHSVMRTLLGGYAGTPPAEIRFSCNAYGKPEIESGQNPRQLRFNLSHSAGMAVLAVSNRYELGVDLEMVRPIDHDIAEHHFSRHELLTLRGLPQETWLDGFYRCWTSKEAVLKGEGVGLNLPLDAFDVETHPQRAPALLSLRLPASIAPGWLLFELKPAENAVGTLAVRDETGELRGENIHYFSFSG